MARLKMLALAASFSVSAFCFLPLTHAADADKFEIVGLKLGMTPEQALTVLRAHKVKEESISVSRLSYRYDDGLKSYSTEEFTHVISAEVNEQVNGVRRTDTFNLYFSPPPEGGKLVAMIRTIENRVDPVTTGQFRDALAGKYGEPTVKTGGILNWKFGGGTKNCVSSSPNGVGIKIPHPTYRKNESILDLVLIRAGNQYTLDRFRTPRVTSLEDCASMLEYSIGSMDSKPATSVSAKMIDVKSWVKAELAASKWVDNLRQAAIKKREGAGNKPPL